MLTADEVEKHAADLWRAHADELPQWDDIRGYMRGEKGRPTLPDDPDDELKELSRLSVMNIMPLVVDTFVDALSVIGYRSPDAQADAPVYGIWQRERMDARQSEIYRPAVTYGTSYVLLDRVDGETRFNPRSPRRMYAAYADPSRDEWPVFALETWLAKDGNTTIRRGILWDDEAGYPIVVRGSARTSRVVVDDDSGIQEHDFGVCPVVRFVNRFDVDDEDRRGEVAPLINDQRGINAVNFDRLVVSRFGAFPQKYVAGWAPETSNELARMSAKRMLAFDDENVKPGAFPAANVTAYNEILSEQFAHAATKARVQVYALTGHFSNVGSETVALIDSPNQRKTAAKRRSFGESVEQMLRLAASAEGVDVPDDAEVVWDDTEARSFAQVVDGITKLVASGVPVRDTIDMIPGLTQQKVDAILANLDRADAQSLTAQILAARQSPAEVATA